MSPEKLRDELLRQEESGGGGVPSLDVDRIVRRERRRVWCWAAVSVALWTVTAAYFLLLLLGYLIFIHPAIHEFFTNPEVASDERWRHSQQMRILVDGLRAMLYWPVLLFLSAACTTVFTIVSRRATLRQIQANLARISAQLRALTENHPTDVER